MAPKLIYTVILWYRFVVRSPAPPGGGPSLCDRPLPLSGGTGPTKEGGISREGVRLGMGTSAGTRVLMHAPRTFVHARRHPGPRFAPQE